MPRLISSALWLKPPPPRNKLHAALSANPFDDYNPIYIHIHVSEEEVAFPSYLGRRAAPSSI